MNVTFGYTLTVLMLILKNIPLLVETMYNGYVHVVTILTVTHSLSIALKFPAIIHSRLYVKVVIVRPSTRYPQMSPSLQNKLVALPPYREKHPCPQTPTTKNQITAVIPADQNKTALLILHQYLNFQEKQI